MIAQAQPFLEALAAENRFTLDFTKDAGQINETNLARYQVFVQLQLAPFNMARPSSRRSRNSSKPATAGSGFTPPG